MGPFNNYEKNVHSQNGEDGVIREILNRLNLNNLQNWCVEFGAWDGIYLSNTFALVEEGWNAIYIEGRRDRFNDLLDTARKYPSIRAIETFVSHDRNTENSLDKILSRTDLPKDFELLSIDIDSFDLDIWESLTTYSPKIVVIEINSSVMPGVIWRHSNKTPGNTFSATLRVGQKKGFTLVCHTGNLIFVRNDYMDLIKLDKQFIDYPEKLFLLDSPWINDFKINQLSGFSKTIYLLKSKFNLRKFK